MNGAIVYDVKNEEIIGETYLRKEHVDKLLKFRIIIMNCLLYLKIILFMLVINQILF